MAHSARNRSKKASGGKLAKGRSTRNRARKELYAKMAESAARTRGSSALVGSDVRSFGRVQRKTNHNRGHTQMAREARKAEAAARAEELKHMSFQQRLDRLDKRLGKGVGAQKERNKLINLMKLPSEVKALKKVENEIELSPEERKSAIRGLKQFKKEVHDKKMRENRNGR